MGNRLIFRKKIAVILMMALFFNTITPYAAIVSDNDGSAFVTKGEFEALKYSFDKQIKNYEDSLSGKIDGAIAAYLAGINVSKATSMENASSIILYPLTFQMKNLRYNWGDWDDPSTGTGRIPYWAPGYGIYLYGNRGGSQFVVQYDKDMNVQYDRFYNGEWDYVLDKYKIKSMLDDVSGTTNINGCFYHLRSGHSLESNVYFGFCFDQKTFQTRHNVSGVTSRYSDIKQSGYDLIPFKAGYTSYSNLYAEAIWAWNGTGALTIGTDAAATDTNKVKCEKYLDTFKAFSGGWYEGSNTAVSEYGYNSVLKSTTKNGIDLIMNATPSRTQHIELPVAYESTIYLTNKNNFKIDLMAGTAAKKCEYYNGYRPGDWSTVDPTVWWFGNFVSNGWTIEPQFSETAHYKDNRSLMYPQDMYYEVTTPYTKTKKNQIMTDGILLTEADNNKAYIATTFNLNIPDTTNKKYLVMSKSPIPEYDVASMSEANLLDIYKTSSFTSGTKKFELKTGENIAYVKEINKNELLYYKILWKQDNSIVELLEKPTIVGAAE